MAKEIVRRSASEKRVLTVQKGSDARRGGRSIGMDEYAKESLFREDVRAFVISSKEHWKGIVGGSLVFIALGAFASAGFEIPKTISGIAAFCLALSFACFLAFRSERRALKVAMTELDELKNPSNR